MSMLDGLFGATRTVYAGAATIADLRGFIGVYDGQLASLKCHTDQGDGGGGDFYWDEDGAEADNDGTVIGSGTGRWIRRVSSGPLNPRWFGAKGDDVDDTASVAAAAAAMSTTNRALHFPPGVYRITAGVALNLAGAHLLITGDRAEIKISNSAAVSVFTPQACASFALRGIHFSTTKTNSANLDRAVFVSSNLAHLSVEGNSFDRVGIYVNDLTLNRTPSIADAMIRGNQFYGSGTGLLGSDTSNFLDLRGISGLSIVDNDYRASGFERFAKISGACEDVVIVGNRFNSTSTIGKQLIDCYSDANRVTCIGNTGYLYGTWTAFFEAKNGDTGSGIDSEPRDICVANNVVLFSVGNATVEGVGLFGAWGLTGEAAGAHSATVIGNEFRCLSTTRAFIAVRGMTNATIANNQVLMPTPTQYFVAVEASNNESAIVSGNHLNGLIQCNGHASHPGGTYYGSQPLRISVTGNLVDDYGSLGAINVVSCSGLLQCVIANNVCNASGTYSATYGISVTGDVTYPSTVSDLVVTGNSVVKNGSANFGHDAYSTITKLTVEGNSFAPPYRTFTASDATPSVNKYPIWRTANAAPTTVTYFDDTEIGDTWLVIVNDANTTIACVGGTGTNLVAAGADLTPGSGDVLRCTNLNGTKIYVERIDL